MISKKIALYANVSNYWKIEQGGTGWDSLTVDSVSQRCLKFKLYDQRCGRDRKEYLVGSSEKGSEKTCIIVDLGLWLKPMPKIIQ